ncbi:hypothetical protein IJT93_04295 [bacterium]|nr:hypothetical protein [bacterium]
MHKFLKKAIFASVVGSFLIAPLSVWADKSLLTEEYHKYETLGAKVVTRGGAEHVRSVISNPDVHILILQIPFADFDLSCCGDIMDWVRKGHSLWYYDSRYAPYFGMKAYALSSKQFKGKDEEGELGELKYKGKAAGVMSFEKHESMAGVGQCTVFLPEIERDVYSAVTVEGDTVPLLQFASDSPALAAVRRDGRGLVVFKCLLWPESLSGKRFQYNLLDYSAGYGVPGVGGEGRVGELIGPEAKYVESSQYVKAVGGSKSVSAKAESGSGTEVSKGARYEGRVYARSLDGEDRTEDKADKGGEGRWQERFGASEGSSVKQNSSVKGAEYMPESRINFDKVKDSADVSALESRNDKENAGNKEPNYSDGSLVDVVFLRSGEKYIGRCHSQEINLETTADSFKGAPEEFKEIDFSSNSWSLDKAVTKSGQSMSGYMLTAEFYFSNAEGQTTFKKDAIKSIKFGVPFEKAASLRP